MVNVGATLAVAQHSVDRDDATGQGFVGATLAVGPQEGRGKPSPYDIPLAILLAHTNHFMIYMNRPPPVPTPYLNIAFLIFITLKFLHLQSS